MSGPVGVYERGGGGGGGSGSGCSGSSGGENDGGKRKGTNQKLGFDVHWSGRYLVGGTTCGNLRVWDLLSSLSNSRNGDGVGVYEPMTVFQAHDGESSVFFLLSTLHDMHTYV